MDVSEMMELAGDGERVREGERLVLGIGVAADMACEGGTYMAGAMARDGRKFAKAPGTAGKIGYDPPSVLPAGEGGGEGSGSESGVPATEVTKLKVASCVAVA